MASYRRYLLGMPRFRQAAESGVKDACAARWPQWQPTLLSPALADDLNDLAMPGMPNAGAPCIHGETDHLLGMLYVLEGASLGARLLIKDARALGLDGQHGARHLQAQFNSLNAWRDYLAILDGAADLNMDRVIESARGAFLRARQAFDDVAP